MVKKRKTKGLTIAAILLFIFSVAYMCLGISIPSFPNTEYTESNTAEYTATVSRVEENGGEYRIYMNEYNVCIVVRPEQLVSQEVPSDIREDEVIEFRTIHFIEYPGVGDVSVLALRTEDIQFITLERSNQLVRGDMQMASIAGIVFAAVLFIIAVILVVIVVRRKKQNKINFARDSRELTGGNN